MIGVADRLAALRTPGLAERVRPFVDQGVVSTNDAYLVDVLSVAVQNTSVEAALWACLVLAAQGRGHSALPIAEVPAFLAPRVEPGADPPEPLSWPADPGDYLTSPLAAGEPALIQKHDTPDGPVFQTPRMEQEERWIAEQLLSLAAPVPAPETGFLRPSPTTLQRGLDRFETQPDGTEHPGRALMAALAERRLAIITGGPGTGKTWSIKRVLAMLFEAADEAGQTLDVRLAAPTGKAGVRMREAMGEELDSLDVDESVRERLRQLESSTLHRLLRIRPGSGTTRFGPDNPLSADVIIVDEASMISLPLMRQLVRAIGPTTRLVLLGDRDQLPSVEVGSVLSDLVEHPFRAALDPSAQAGPLGEVLARFTFNHRSHSAPTLARLVTCLQDETDDKRSQAHPILCDGEQAPNENIAGRIHQEKPKDHGGRLNADQLDRLVAPWTADLLSIDGSAPAEHPGYITELTRLFEQGTDARQQLAAAVEMLLKRFDRYRVLAVHRRGPTGVSGLQRAVESRLKHTLQAAWASGRDGAKLPTRSGKWLGQAVLVTRNAYDLDLWNGDIGLVLPDPDHDLKLAVAFPQSKPDVSARHRFVPIDRLPEHSGAFVMTIHKSQGSQFDHVAVVLSPKPSPIQTRELVYTGITRASQRVTWYGTSERLKEALETPVRRGSRLADRLIS